MNIGVYRTKEFKRARIEKAKRIRQSHMVSSSAFDTDGVQTRYGNLELYSTGNPLYDAVLGGLILGIVAALRLKRFGSLDFYLGSLLTGIVGVLVLYQVRKSKAMSLGFNTQLVIWPIGVIITLITSLLPFGFLLFGFFQNSNANRNKDEAIVGIYTVVCSIMLGLGLIIISLIESLPFSAQFNIGILFIGQLFMVIALLLMLPFGMLDGRKIYDWDRRSYWMLLVPVLIFYLYFSL